MKKIAVVEYGQTKAPRIGLMLKADRSDGYGSGPYWHLTGTAVEIAEDGSPRNLSDRQPLADAEIRAQADRDSEKSYGWSTVEIHVTTWTYINAERARMIASTLTTIQKRLGQLNDRYGCAESLATGILRVGDALGVDSYLIKVGGESNTYHENQWREMDAVTAFDWIREQESNGIESLKS
jgi:hypothetical protein